MNKAETNIVPGLREKDLKQISPIGFGDPRNCYPHSMVWFKDHLYVGTSRHNFSLYKKWHPALNNVVIWPVQTPKDNRDLDIRAQIWRYNPRTAEWSMVYRAPMVAGNDGRDTPLSVAFRIMSTFQGEGDSEPALYTPTLSPSTGPGSVMLRSGNGTDFEVVSEPALGLGTGERSYRALTSFNGRLFITPVMGRAEQRWNEADCPGILVSSNPNGGRWHQACEPFLGNPNNASIATLINFNGFLYAGTFNPLGGFEIWKTAAEGSPPYQWIQVLAHGAYRYQNNQAAATMQVFDNCLYIGTAVQGGGIDAFNKIGPVAPELIMIHSDDSWDLIMGEPRITPNGLKVPLSGLGPGFNNPFAGYLWQMCHHEGWLYAGTMVWLPFLPFSRREKWPERLARVLTPKVIEIIVNKFGGCHLWRTRNGTDWVCVNRNGFGDPLNLGIRSMVSTPYGLFVGIANAFGPELATKRMSGWSYELNPSCGLKILLGNRFTNQTSSAMLTRSEGYELQATKPKNNPDDSKLVANLIDEYYGNSGYRYVGCWKIGIDNAKAACDNLIAEIVSFIPERKGKVLDLGCREGVSTAYLARYFSSNDITGVTTSRQEIALCRQNVPMARFYLNNLFKMRLQHESFDYVVCVEGPLRLGNKSVLKNIYKILKSGGCLVGSDILYNNKKKTVNLFKKTLYYLNDLNEYNNILLDIGFREVNIVDATYECWSNFCRHRETFFQMKMAKGEIDENIINEIKADMPGNDLTVNHYILFCAIK